jgi:hypothetical protein
MGKGIPRISKVTTYGVLACFGSTKNKENTFVFQKQTMQKHIMEYNIVFFQKRIFTNLPNEVHVVPQCVSMK